MSKRDNGNPNSIIQHELQRLRSEREQTLSDIDSLEEEKKVIQKILPKVYYELSQVREGVELKKRELVVFDTAIEEVEKNYGDFLYSPEIFRSNDA
mmetsp:Transcript_5462/g.12213  ORF Transcript_5462/g.12213 Transcript_5462/m.12213 type:complete len:96 (+) Transcript_5462:170-457(+)|eukprot:CAMPEP_0173207360 /NCGR_PEP_ID=MMETSP1141-20130122/21891_1 /TAXON_ID=483371 /ORGANISM="non described non described, Strain CCMP2298" /LENGTH=95 /DNA_ID=CAMNT_0014133639 /DNA_START=82 /DNA_END=369 /DNA_ORIENTATION=+